MFFLSGIWYLVPCDLLPIRPRGCFFRLQEGGSEGACNKSKGAVRPARCLRACVEPRDLKGPSALRRYYLAVFVEKASENLGGLAEVKDKVRLK